MSTSHLVWCWFFKTFSKIIVVKNFFTFLSNSWLIKGVYYGRDKIFSKIFCWVNHLSLVWTCITRIANCGTIWDLHSRRKISKFSLIPGWLWAFIMGGVKFFSNFLLGLTPQRLCWGHIWTCMTSRANLGPFGTSIARGLSANSL